MIRRNVHKTSQILLNGFWDIATFLQSKAITTFQQIAHVQISILHNSRFIKTWLTCIIITQLCVQFAQMYFSTTIKFGRERRENWVQIYFRNKRENSWHYFWITYITKLQSKFCCANWQNCWKLQNFGLLTLQIMPPKEMILLVLTKPCCLSPNL